MIKRLEFNLVLHHSKKYEQLSKHTSELPPLSVGEFLFETPLYECKRVSDDKAFLSIFESGQTKIDGYCPECGKDSVFHSRRINDGIPEEREYSGILFASLLCQRRYHEIRFALEAQIITATIGDTIPKKMTTGFVMKIGQTPSHADLSRGELKNFSKVLKGDDRIEFNRANVLAAHGANIGAFVYLRRVFERLILRAKERAGENIDLDQFQKSRVNEKITLLTDYLPPFMVDNSRVYAVLSKGIHELDEDTCGGLYELLHKSCLLMLEQEKDLFERERLEAELAASIKKIEV